MKRQQAYKYRLDVRDRLTATHLSRLAGCCRFVWNRALSLSEDKYPGFKALCAMLPGWKNELPWLADCDSIALQQVLRNFDRAWQNYFKFPESFDRRVAKHRFVHDASALSAMPLQKRVTTASGFPNTDGYLFDAVGVGKEKSPATL